MPISGVVISCNHDSAAIVAGFLESITQLVIHHVLENDRLVAVLDTGTVDYEVSIVKEIMQTEGVIDVRLAYHNFEDLEEVQS